MNERERERAWCGAACASVACSEDRRPPESLRNTSVVSTSIQIGHLCIERLLFGMVRPTTHTTHKHHNNEPITLLFHRPRRCRHHQCTGGEWSWRHSYYAWCRISLWRLRGQKHDQGWRSRPVSAVWIPNFVQDEDETM